MLAGCAAKPVPTFVPHFATLPYNPFNSAAVVAITLREWKAWGSKIDDDPPGTRPDPAPEDKPERQEGYWQRVGEYWFTGQDADAPERQWTGMHDADGNVFPASKDGDFAWSAAFVSYVMRVAAAGPRFPYASNHSTYINLAKDRATGIDTGYAILAHRPSDYAPLPGDLICTGRGQSAGIAYDDLPAQTFPSHCDIVISREANALSVIGGNVDDAVTMKHVPTSPSGKLADGGTVLDTRYPWFVVIEVLYPAKSPAGSPCAAQPGPALPPSNPSITLKTCS